MSAAFTAGSTAAFAVEPALIDSALSWLALENDTRASEEAKPDLAPEIEARKSYLIPALEIIGFDLLLNRFDRHHFGGDDYDTSLSTIRRTCATVGSSKTIPFK